MRPFFFFFFVFISADGAFQLRRTTASRPLRAARVFPGFRPYRRRVLTSSRIFRAARERTKRASRDDTATAARGDILIFFGSAHRDNAIDHVVVTRVNALRRLMKAHALAKQCAAVHGVQAPCERATYDVSSSSSSSRLGMSSRVFSATCIINSWSSCPARDRRSFVSKLDASAGDEATETRVAALSASNKTTLSSLERRELCRGKAGAVSGSSGKLAKICTRPMKNSLMKTRIN